MDFAVAVAFCTAKGATKEQAIAFHKMWEDYGMDTSTFEKAWDNMHRIWHWAS